MRKPFGEYEIDTDTSRIQFDVVHGWLTGSYWSPGVSYEKVVRAAENSSTVVSVFAGDAQVGYMRVISDRTTFAWICDVFVDEGHRGKGIAKAMVGFALEHPDYAGLRRWVLATRDAHPIYAACGFEPIKANQRWMIRGANPKT